MQSLQDIPLDDIVCEGPHSRAGYVWKRSRRTKLPFVASSLRLVQNLNDVRELLPPQINLQALWNDHAAMLRPSCQRRRKRSVRIPEAVKLDEFYRLRAVRGAILDGVVAPEAVAYDPADEAVDDAAPAECDLTDDERLLKEWLQHCLQINAFITLEEQDALRGPLLRPVQLLRLSSEFKVLKTHQAKTRRVMGVMVQPLELHGPPQGPGAQRLQTYAMEDR